MFTIGYEGRAIAELLVLLRTNGVDTLVDVRLNAVSRRRGYSKRSLGDALRAVGITYVHERDLGNPVENRDGYRKGSVRARQRYQRRVQTQGQAALERVRELARMRDVALLCFERDADLCHRSFVAEQVGLRAIPL